MQSLLKYGGQLLVRLFQEKGVRVTEFARARNAAAEGGLYAGFVVLIIDILISYDLTRLISFNAPIPVSQLFVSLIWGAAGGLGLCYFSHWYHGSDRSKRRTAAVVIGLAVGAILVMTGQAFSTEAFTRRPWFVLKNLFANRFGVTLAYLALGALGSAILIVRTNFQKNLAFGGSLKTTLIASAVGSVLGYGLIIWVVKIGGWLPEPPHPMAGAGTLVTVLKLLAFSIIYTLIVFLVIFLRSLGKDRLRKLLQDIASERE